MSKLKILVTGASGLVGSRFIEKYSDKFNFVTPEYPQFDLTNKEQVSQLLEKENPDWIVNFAAFTDVNASEAQSGDETGPAWQGNVEGTKNLSDSFSVKNPEIIKDKNIILIDDVLTTGATLTEAKKILKSFGAKKVIAFTVAH